jgi:hypothetical protein
MRKNAANVGDSPGFCGSRLIFFNEIAGFGRFFHFSLAARSEPAGSGSDARRILGVCVSFGFQGSFG